jgi:hypothetical protein
MVFLWEEGEMEWAQKWEEPELGVTLFGHLIPKDKFEHWYKTHASPSYLWIKARGWKRVRSLPWADAEEKIYGYVLTITYPQHKDLSRVGDYEKPFLECFLYFRDLRQKREQITKDEAL